MEMVVFLFAIVFLLACSLGWFAFILSVSSLVESAVLSAAICIAGIIILAFAISAIGRFINWLSYKL